MALAALGLVLAKLGLALMILRLVLVTLLDSASPQGHCPGPGGTLYVVLDDSVSLYRHSINVDTVVSRRT